MKATGDSDSQAKQVIAKCWFCLQVCGPSNERRSYFLKPGDPEMGPGLLTLGLRNGHIFEAKVPC